MKKIKRLLAVICAVVLVAGLINPPQLLSAATTVTSVTLKAGEGISGFTDGFGLRFENNVEESAGYFGDGWSCTGNVKVSLTDSGEVVLSATRINKIEIGINLTNPTQALEAADIVFSDAGVKVTSLVKGEEGSGYDYLATILLRSSNTADVTVTPNAKNATYRVTYPKASERENYTLNDSPATVGSGEDLVFKATPDSGYALKAYYNYEGSSDETEITGELGENNQYTFTVEAVTGNINVTVKASPVRYKLTVQQNEENYTLTVSPSTIGPDDSATITAVPKEGYDYLDAADLTATSGTITNISQGLYQLAGVNKDTEISVKNVKTKQYTLTFQSGIGFTYQTEEGEPLTGTVKVNAGDDYAFKVVADEGYTVQRVWNGGTELDAAEGVYTISKIASDSTVTASAAVASYTIVLPEASDAYSFAMISQIPVQHGGSYSFTVTAAEGYNPPTVKVKAGEEEVAFEKSGNTYTVSNVTSDQTIEVTGGGKKTFNVTWEDGTGYTWENISYKALERSQRSLIAYGTEVSFKVNANVGYEVTGVWANNRRLTAGEDGIYRIVITEDTEITAAAQKQSLSVAFEEPAEKHYTVIGGGNSVLYGEAYSFTLVSETGYNVPQVEVSTNDGGSYETLTPNGDVYVVTNVTANLKIKITETGKQKFPVTFSTGTGYHFTDSEGGEISSSVEAAYGESYSFKLVLNEGYTDSQAQVFVNNVLCTPSEGTYTITNIREATLVTVSGISRNSYTMTLTGAEGAALSTSQSSTVYAGDSFRFTVNLDAAYSNSGYEFTLNEAPAGDRVQLISGHTYEIKNIMKNYAIGIQGLTKNTYHITYTATQPDMDGKYTATPSGDGVVAEHGNSFTFQVAPVNPGYAITQVVVNGTALAEVNGNYTIASVTGDTQVQVGVEEKSVTVHYVDAVNPENTRDIVYIGSQYETPVIGGGTYAGYTFAGWFKDENYEEEVTTITDFSQDMTLYAKWNVNIEEMVNLTTTEYDEGTNDGKKTIRYSTQMSFTNAPEDAVVKGFGTLYSNESFSDIQENISGQLLARVPSESEEYKSGWVTGIEKKVYNYYFDGVNAAPGDVNGRELNIRISVSTTASGYRYAAGWMHIAVAGEEYLVTAEPVETTLTPAASSNLRFRMRAFSLEEENVGDDFEFEAETAEVTLE